jgi:phosphoenolpyruvate synthase/pyruvate phosphate dikinase
MSHEYQNITYVLDFRAVDRTQVSVVGGKGAQLGELSRVDGVNVPDGFCVTTDAFRRFMAEAPSLEDPLERMARLAPSDREAIVGLSEQIRRTLETTALPDDLAAAITGRLAVTGDRAAYAVRSSATAEDLLTASFAGQHDSYLDVVGVEPILEHVRRVWASLFSERAVAYRLRHGFGHRGVQMAVVVQRMIPAEAAGVLFTADPVSSNRRVASIDATFGLGEALVSGLVNADTFKVRNGELIAKAAQEPPTLGDAQVVRLVELGRRIEAHFGLPQDIEWCRVGDEFWIVQSRPITTLFPIPEVADGDNHVYVSVGHQQMMTETMKPLGISMWQLTAMAPMLQAGGRLFVDVTGRLAAPATQAGLLSVFGRGDPLIGDALQRIVDRGDFLPSNPESTPERPSAVFGPPPEIDTDPAIVTTLIERSEASVAGLTNAIRTTSGPALFDVLREAFVEHKRALTDPESLPVIMAGMQAAWWLNEHVEAWLGEKNVADTLTLSAPGNITSEMGLDLLDVADAIRPHPDVVAFLHHVEDESFLDELPKVAGGREAQAAIQAYLERYGMRGVGEIDITRPRWSERPSTLVPAILTNIENFPPGAAARRFEEGREKAAVKEREILQRLRELPDGEQKAEETKRMIDRVRTFAGYREYPKYGIISRYFVYKRALMREVDRLVEAGVLTEREDSFYLTFDELRDAVATRQADAELVRRRRAEFEIYETLTPPRVLTSEGEIVTGVYRRPDLPEGALVGVAVSAGTVEGRARVLHDIAEADLTADDILVTTYTDPSWTPLFLAIKGLVTEVGGLMTHGAVIAREYGLPAVVGVEGATTLIQDGQRIRLHGTEGYVELITAASR